MIPARTYPFNLEANIDEEHVIAVEKDANDIIITVTFNNQEPILLKYTESLYLSLLEVIPE